MGSETALAVIESKHEVQVSEYHRKATDVAGLVKAIVTQKAVQIGPRKYVPVDAYQAIANAMGCTTSARDVKRVEGGYTAIGEVKRISDGAILAEGEGFVGDDEPKWAKGPEYARRSMVQTRAIGRACRAAFAFVVPMIDLGLSSTPAEEMEGIDLGTTTPPAPKGVAATVAAVVAKQARPSPPPVGAEEAAIIHAQERGERQHPDFVVRFGSAKGKRISQLDEKSLRFYEKCAAEAVEDPEKARFRAANEQELAAIREEIALR